MIVPTHQRLTLCHWKITMFHRKTRVNHLETGQNHPYNPYSYVSLLEGKPMAPHRHGTNDCVRPRGSEKGQAFSFTFGSYLIQAKFVGSEGGRGQDELNPGRSFNFFEPTPQKHTKGPSKRVIPYSKIQLLNPRVSHSQKQDLFRKPEQTLPDSINITLDSRAEIKEWSIVHD